MHGEWHYLWTKKCGSPVYYQNHIFQSFQKIPSKLSIINSAIESVRLMSIFFCDKDITIYYTLFCTWFVDEISGMSIWASLYKKQNIKIFQDEGSADVFLRWNYLLWNYLGGLLHSSQIISLQINEKNKVKIFLSSQLYPRH